MLLALGGNATPSADDVKVLLEKSSVEVDAEKLTHFMGKMEGKNIDELIEEGKAKMKAIQGAAGSGSGGKGGAGGGGAGDGGAAEEAKEEEEEEEVDVGGGGLFGGDDEGY